MLFSLAILFFISPTFTAATDLQTQCTGTGRLYSGTSCYVLNDPWTTSSRAKISCNHILGYSGHLAHIRNAAARAAVKQLMSSYTVRVVQCAYTGLELLNPAVATTISTNWGYYYRDGIYASTTYLPWLSSHPSTNSNQNRASYCFANDGLVSRPESSLDSYICEYEEALKQPVTDLEQKCVNLTSSLYTSFVNGVCYVMHNESKNYNDAKIACNDISGHKGHLSHVRTMGELWVADALLNAARVTYARLGIEQTNLSSTDPNNNWYMTTPTDLSVLTIYLPWAASPTTNMRTIAVTIGYPKTFNAVDSNTVYPFICQYGNATTTTTTTTTMPTTKTTTTRPACTTPLTTTAGGTGTTAATTNGGRRTSTFNHYRFGYFKNTCYWLDQLTVSFSKCLNMCHENNLCFGFSYNSGTSDCQLLAIIASASPYWFELTADKQYETVIRE
uniref:C-type lectin domain-containing protein n=1 Tax=Plectus sambesii TaxID=2011161 RepID=A0A914UP99_9BILA